MKKPVVTVIKAFILIVLIVAYGIWSTAIEPVFTNEMAMQQMQNADFSSTGIATYSYVRNYAWIGFVVVGLLLFYKEIIAIFKKLTNNVQEKEKTYEESK